MKRIKEKLKIKGRKADIPITILVLGVLLICALTIISFIISDKKMREDFLGVEVIEGINSDIEIFNFYKNVGFSNEGAAEKINAVIEGEYLIIEKEGFTSRGTKFISVEYRKRIK